MTEQERLIRIRSLESRAKNARDLAAQIIFEARELEQEAKELKETIDHD